MDKSKIILTLGVGYLCTKLPNIKKVDIRDKLIMSTDIEGTDIAVFITDNNVCDSIIIVRINSKKSIIKLISFKNEIKIDDYEISDILKESEIVDSINKLNEKLGLSINQYIKLDYFVLEDIINSINGVKIKLNYNDKKFMGLEDDNEIYILNGQQVIQYIKFKGDKGCTKKSTRQKTIINTIINDLTDKGIKEFLNVVSKSIKCIESSMSTKELVSTGFSVIKIGTDNIEKSSFPKTNKLNFSDIDKYDLITYKEDIKSFLLIGN